MRNRGVPICYVPVSSIHISFSVPLFPLHNYLSPISFTSIQLVALFCPDEVSSSLSFSLHQSSPRFHSAFHLSISNFPFVLNLPFSVLFFLSCARSSSRVPAATPAALPPLFCAKLFPNKRWKYGRREEEWLKREWRQINQRSHFHLVTLDTFVTTAILTLEGPHIRETVNWLIKILNN